MGGNLGSGHVQDQEQHEQRHEGMCMDQTLKVVWSGCSNVGNEG